MHNTIIKLENENLWQRKLKNYKYNGKVGKHTCMHINEQNSEMWIIYILLVKFKWQATVIKTDLFISCGSNNNFIFWFFRAFLHLFISETGSKKMLLLTCQESWHLEKSRCIISWWECSTIRLDWYFTKSEMLSDQLI